MEKWLSAGGQCANLGHVNAVRVYNDCDLAEIAVYDCFFQFRVLILFSVFIYSVSQKKSSLRTCGNFSKTDGNFSTKFYVPIVHSYLR